MCPSDDHSVPCGSLPVERPAYPDIVGTAFSSHSLTPEHFNLSDVDSQATNRDALLGLDIVGIGAWVTDDSALGLGTASIDASWSSLSLAAIGDGLLELVQPQPDPYHDEHRLGNRTSLEEGANEDA